MQAALDLSAAERPPLRVVAVGSDRDGTGAAARAAAAGLPVFTVRPAGYVDRAAWDRALADAVAVHDPDWLLLAGFLRLVGPEVLTRWPGRILNLHPALLPSFPGLHAVRDALAYGVRVTGTTLFLVDAGTDSGPVVAQRAVPVAPGDTEDVLHERIKEVERAMLTVYLPIVVGGGLALQGRHVRLGRDGLDDRRDR